VADLRSGRPMRRWLHYRVGSVTKPFVATVMLQLVAEGRVSLQDTVERWLPGILPYGDQVTVRQLLSHTSGVPDYTLEPIVRLYTDPQARFRAWTPGSWSRWSPTSRRTSRRAPPGPTPTPATSWPA
jgi:D-alanyl-D-alanine carboxypeptidase